MGWRRRSARDISGACLCARREPEPFHTRYYRFIFRGARSRTDASKRCRRRRRARRDCASATPPARPSCPAPEIYRDGRTKATITATTATATIMRPQLRSLPTPAALPQPEPLRLLANVYAPSCFGVLAQPNCAPASSSHRLRCGIAPRRPRREPRRRLPADRSATRQPPRRSPAVLRWPVSSSLLHRHS
ncbi:hypothetical protein BH24ACT21_BH24ACT21_13840 [soil metagenome]